MPGRRTFLTTCGALAAGLISPRRGNACDDQGSQRPDSPDVAGAEPRKAERTGDRFIQPEYDRWRRVKPGMTEDEVIALLGEPLERNEPYAMGVDDPAQEQTPAARSVTKQYSPCNYGVIRYDSPSMPGAFEFMIGFVDGRVHDKRDPFNGRFSADGKPTTPELSLPANATRFDHYPRFLDLRWLPSSGVYPVEYEIEIAMGYESVNGVTGDVEQFSYDSWGTLRSPIPYVAEEFIGGGQPGRWRVRAKNRLGVSDWSDYWYFVFSR